MLYHVRMDVRIPVDMDPDVRADLVAREREYSQQLQRDGVWPYIWRIAGEYANYSILDCRDHDHLHEVLAGLPLYPFMVLEVTPLAEHPSDIKAG